VHGLTAIQKGTIEMTTVSRRATTIWDGDLIHGRGTVNSASRALHEMPNTFENRIGGPNGRTSPVELIAAVHPDCFATALPYLLTQEGHPPELLDVSAAVSIDEISGASTITASQSAITGRAQGIDDAAFRDAAKRAGSECPVSRALAAVNITVNATLSQSN
jgi:osmotically inducible protein OsmC